jgi:transcriptional regulator of NAD metabolism
VPAPSEPVVAPVTAEEPPDPEVSHRLVINLTQSSNKDSDLERLQRVIDTLKEFPGHDRVSLQVTYESRVTHLRMPDLATSYCAELGERLAELVGEEGVRVE